MRPRFICLSFQFVGDKWKPLNTNIFGNFNISFPNSSQESSSATDWRSIKPQIPPYAGSKQLSRKHSADKASLSDLRGMEMDASTSMPSEANHGMMVNSSPKMIEGAEHPRQPSVASSTLVELTTRLDFFKERRSQLMEQLHSLDLSHGASSQSLAYKSSPPWNDPR
ncbi:hypothetical protein GW17_00056331 [Ensete ventricosum]|uniref:Uncharacterized protein n=1 Tax=Ensete ventricosum TaxID=4639 RepID=A0A426WY07_ENSVE|nr:hypothetical protein B296_00055855 [Ensete ventricosum]RWV82189.1 hypothetical protein GW17_00056331 [Ensete ventricosum]RZR98530.1 hypothetical protein BHM03_00027895 [Ensete ventricosum]